LCLLTDQRTFSQLLLSQHVPDHHRGRSQQLQDR